MSELLKDPMFFYGIAFVIFIGLAYRFGRVGALSWIDGEIQKVRSQLDEAQNLRAEAEATLAQYKAKQATALAEAEALVCSAKDEASRLKAQAEADLKSSLARHEQQAIQRIRMAEASALADVRQRAIDLAMDVAQKTLQSKLHGEAASRLVDQAIADLPAAATKAKAA
jgi:F-type H+-transporting ATPase subunit b